MKRRLYLQDNNKRFVYKKTEIEQRLLKLLMYKKPLAQVVKKFFFFKFSKVHYKSCIHGFCVITGRSRGIYKKLRTSRISFKRLGYEGFFFGLKKASW